MSFTDTDTTIYVGPSTAIQQSTVIPDAYGSHRFWVIADLQDDGYLQIDELKLFAVPVAVPPVGVLEDVTNLGLTLSSGGSYPLQSPENAFGSPGSWYSGASSGATYIGRDLGGPRTIRRIGVLGTASYSFSGRVKFSDDGVVWTNTSTTIDVGPGATTLQLFSIQDYGSHRYWAVFDGEDDAYLQVDELSLFATVPSVPTALTIVSHTPAAGASGVRYAPITVVFNTPIAESTLSDSTVRLETIAGGVVLTTRAYDPQTNTLQLTPQTTLAPLTTYRVRVSGRNEGVASVSGVKMDSDYSWAFSTAASGGLAGAWAFAEGTGNFTIDSSGNGNTAAVNGATWSSGGLTLDGTDDYVAIPDADTLDIRDQITVSLWVRLTSLAGERPLVAKTSAAAGYTYSVWTNASNAPSARFVLNGTEYVVAAPSGLSLNTRSFVAATYNGIAIRLFVDGVEVASAPASGRFADSSGTLLFGASNVTSPSLHGEIDDVRLHDVALSSGQLNTLRLTAVSNATAPAPIAAPAGGFYSQVPAVTLTAIPGATLTYTVNGAAPTLSSTPYTQPIVLPQSGGILQARAFLGTVAGTVLTETYTVDTTAPTIVAVPIPGVISGWMNTPVTVTFRCSDPAGIAVCPSPIQVTEDGPAQVISGTAVDSVGNQRTVSITVGIDRTAPVVNLESQPSSGITTDTAVTLSGQVSDALSGISAARCNGVVTPIVGGLVQCSVNLHLGRNDVLLQASDIAGNSTSRGFTVTRVGALTAMTLTPSTRLVVVEQSTQFVLHDGSGVEVKNAAWSSSDDTVITLSADDPPLVTALSPGEVTISAAKDGVVATATITVQAALTLGATLWAIQPATGQTMEPPIYMNRVDDTIADMVGIERETGDAITVSGISGDGALLWRQRSPGIPLMGDSFGGLIAGVPYDVGWTTEFRAYVRVGSEGGVTPWRYESIGYLSKPAQAGDGTIYAMEFVPGATVSQDHIWDKHVIVLNGRTGTLIRRMPIAREAFIFYSDLDGRSLGRLQCRNTLTEWVPETIGPIVGEDGRGYVLARRMVRTTKDVCVQQNNFVSARVVDVGIDVFILSPSAAPVTESVFSNHCEKNNTIPQATICEGPFGIRNIMPNSAGGMLVHWEHTETMVNSQATMAYKLTRFSASQQRADRDVPLSFALFNSSDSALYLYDAGLVRAVDPETLSTKWSSDPGAGLPLAPLRDSETVMMNYATGVLSRVDAAGVVRDTATMNLSHPNQTRYGFWTGIDTTATPPTLVSRAGLPGMKPIISFVPETGTRQSFPTEKRFDTREQAVLAALDEYYAFSAMQNEELGGLICKAGSKFEWSIVLTDHNQSSVSVPSTLCLPGRLAAHFHTHPPKESPDPSGDDRPASADAPQSIGGDLGNAYYDKGTPHYLRARIPGSPAGQWPVKTHTVKYWWTGSGRRPSQNVCVYTGSEARWVPYLFKSDSGANCSTPTP